MADPESARFELSGYGVISVVGAFGFLAAGLVFCFVVNYRRYRWRPIKGTTEVPVDINALDRWFGRVVETVFGSWENQQQARCWEDAVESIGKLIEAIKLVAVFLMVLTPSALLDFRCALPQGLMNQMGMSVFASMYGVPCDSSAQGADLFAGFVRKGNLSPTAIAALKDINTVRCAPYTFIYFGVVLVTEALTLLICVFFSRRMLTSGKAFSAMFFVTAALWGAWPVLLSFRYYGDYLCEVRWAALTTVVFSMWHSAVAVLLYVATLLKKPALRHQITTLLGFQSS